MDFLIESYVQDFEGMHISQEEIINQIKEEGKKRWDSI